MSRRPGRHFLQVPGPTNVPEPVLQAIGSPTIDHRGSDFRALVRGLLPDLGQVFGTESPVLIFPASGSGAWEAALVNTLSPGDRVMVCVSGHFSQLWATVARRLGFDVEELPGDSRCAVDPAEVAARLARDTGHRIRAVAVVHNETSTGVLSDVRAIGEAIGRASHPALLLVDAVSSLGSASYRHDDWGVDVTVAASQKGLMLPPGLAFNVVSSRALDASGRATTPRSFWRWEEVMDSNVQGVFPATPATNLLLGLRVALDLLFEEGLDAVYARHARHARAVHAAVESWDLEVHCRAPLERSPSVTAVRTPELLDADALRAEVLASSNVALGTGLGATAGHVFRIGHLGDLNDAMVLGTLGAVEIELRRRGVAAARSGVAAAVGRLAADQALPGMRPDASG